MFTTIKHGLAKHSKKFLAVACLPSLAITPKIAAAGNITISTSITTPQPLTENGQKLTIDSDGNLAVTSSMATYSSANTGLQIELNSLAENGISTSGNSDSAIGISGIATLSSLVLNSGTITSDLSGSGATVSLTGSGGTTNITLVAGSVISNTATSGYAINSNTTSNTILTITNAGTISTNNYADSVAINLEDSNGGSTLNITNTGTISAGASGTAINLATNGNTASISNSGGITGNITATDGNLNVTNTAGSITGNIDLGTIGTSSLDINGGTITGNVTMGSSNQNVTFGGGSLVGTINGYGKVVIDTPSYVLNGNIGDSSTIYSLTINSGNSLNAASNNNSISATDIFLASSSSLTLGTGALSATVDGSSSGVGTVNLNGTNTLASGTLLGSTNGLAAVTVGNSAVITANDSIKATTVTIGGGTSGSLSLAASKSITGNAVIASGASLTLNNASSVSGRINGSSSGVGTLNISSNSTVTINDSIGTTNSLSAISLASGATLNTQSLLSGVIVATTLSLADSSTLNLGSIAVTGTIRGTSDGVGTVNFNSNNILLGHVGTASNSLSTVTIAPNIIVTAGINSNGTRNNIDATTISIGSGSTLIINGGTLTGVVQGSSDGVGTVNLNSTNTLASGTLLGSGNSLAEVKVGNGATITANDSIKATTLTIGGGTSGSLSLAANKSITGNAVIANGATLTLNNSSSVSGTINAASSGVGTLNISGSSVTVGGNIGATQNLSSLVIASGSTFTAGGNIFATNVALAGTLSLGNTSRTIGGNLTGSGTATISAAQGSHTVTGTFNTASGDTLAVGVASSSSAGSITSGGAATIASGTNLTLAVDTSVSVADGSTYNIISGGSGSSINAIGSSDIDVNGSSSNRYGVIVFTTTQSGDNLVLTATKQAAELSTSDSSSQNAFNAINDANITSGQLLSMQNYINANSTSNSERDAAAQSVSPQADNSTNRTSFSVATASVNVAESRLEALRSGVASGDEASAKGIWIQGFGGSAKQDSDSQSDGYNTQSHGVAIGTDKEILEDSNIGISVSQSSSNVKSKIGLKSIAIDTYQANIYGSVDFDEFFVNGLAGLALNRYSSNRSIPLVNANAVADYSGKTYIAKVTSGTVRNLGNGFNITPAAMLTYAHNQVNKYSESGAGTLDLAVATQTAEFFEGRIGADLDYNFLTTKGTRINPEFSLSYGYDFVGAKQTSTSNFVGQNTLFTSQGSNIYRGSTKVGLGLNIFRIDAITISLAYGYEHKTNYNANSGSARFRYEF